MPQEGQVTVTIPTYIWERADTYFKKNRKRLRKKGIKSTSKLISVWIEEKCALKQSGKLGNQASPQNTPEVS